MNRGQMRLEVRRQLGEPVADLWSDEELNDWLNEGAREMVAETQALQAFYKETTVAGKGEYLLPAAVNEVSHVKYFNGTLNDLRPIDASLVGNGDGSTQLPEFFYVRQYVAQTAGQDETGDVELEDVSNNPNAGRTVLGFWGIPSVNNHTFTVFYIPRHFDMKTDGDVSPIPPEYHRGIIAYAIAIAKEKEEAYAESDQIFMPKFEKAKQKLERKMVARGQSKAFPKAKIVGDSFERGGSSWVQIPDSI